MTMRKLTRDDLRGMPRQENDPSFLRKIDGVAVKFCGPAARFLHPASSPERPAGPLQDGVRSVAGYAPK